MDMQDNPALLAYYGLLNVHARLLERIEGAVEREAGLPLPWFELLAYLHWSGEDRMRMSELADSLLLSRGGATRQVARLEEAGLVTREIPPHDRRATYAVLSDSGRDRVEKALPVFKEAVRRHFQAHLGDDDVSALLGAWVKLLNGFGECEGLASKMEQALPARRS